MSLPLPAQPLVLMCRAAALSGGVAIRMRNDVPLELDFDVGETGSVRFFLAPKAEEETMTMEQL